MNFRCFNCERKCSVNIGFGDDINSHHQWNLNHNGDNNIPNAGQMSGYLTKSGCESDCL